MKLGEIIGADRGDGSKPLDGVRILAIEQMQALPFATQLMAHLGAEVVKVEHPERGDSGRASLPAVREPDGSLAGATFLRNSLSKRSVAIDLKHPDGAALVRRLAAGFDVVAENFQPGALARLGLGYADLAAAHPRLVYLSVSGFGATGESPYASWPAYASIAEAMAGFYEFVREEGQYPTISPSGALGDIGTGLFGVIGVLAALRHRERTGEGQHVDVAMFDAMVAMADLVPFFHSMGVSRRAQVVSGVLGAFRADDGFFIVQAVRQHQLALLAKAVGQPGWLEDERFAESGGYVEHLEDVVRPAIEAWARGKTILQACSELTGQGVVAGPCFSGEHLVDDPHVRAHDMLIEVPRPDAEEPLRVVGNPIKLSKTPQGPVGPWPRLGEHTDEVLSEELELDDRALERLRTAGAIGGGAAPDAPSKEA